jgi:hypothetical protein
MGLKLELSQTEMEVCDIARLLSLETVASKESKAIPVTGRGGL